MLVVDCPEHLDAVRAFARSAGAGKALERQLAYLASYSTDDPNDASVRCRLRRDWAPHSFAFVMEKKQVEGYVRWFVGGLIYSGPGAPLDGTAPALTVDIGPSGRTHSWSVHT